VLGAGGIVGQTMRLMQPSGMDVIYTRREPWFFYQGLDLRTESDVRKSLDAIRPDVIVNLAGESRPDVVEASQPTDYEWVNTMLPCYLVDWCDENGAHLVHVSTQGIFDGEHAPYKPLTATEYSIQGMSPVNRYGRQKFEAETFMELARNWTTVRLTFVLGRRPLPIGRPNPFEQMVEAILEGRQQKQVDNRYFSPCTSGMAAQAIWHEVIRRERGRVVHVGAPIKTSRFDIARRISLFGTAPSPLVRAMHEEFGNIAPRPRDTTYRDTVYPDATNLDSIVNLLLGEYMSLTDDRAIEVSMFLGVNYEQANRRLGFGFGYNHARVAEDWRRSNPKTDDEILEWYRRTDAYIWELSAYHADAGFNYSGMCNGIAEHLKRAGAETALCLGDGIGDLSLTLHRNGLKAIYHDLLDSKTANFALFRFVLERGKCLVTEERGGIWPTIDVCLSEGWNPPRLPGKKIDAVVALDFFEHLPNVEEWVVAMKEALVPGGLFMAQNAFGIGDEEHEGSIPMHLTRNNRFVTDWVPMLERLGFIRQEGGWWRK